MPNSVGQIYLIDSTSFYNLNLKLFNKLLKSFNFAYEVAKENECPAYMRANINCCYL